MVYTDNQEMLSWLSDMISVTCPDKVVWIYGEPQQIVDLCGGFLMIQSDPIPESAKYICSHRKESDAQWIDPPLMYAKTLTALSGSNRNRPMYVFPFAAKDSDKKGVLLTDSVVVVAAMSTKFRFGTDVLDEIGCYGKFMRGVHCTGDGEMCVVSFPEDGTFFAINCGEEHAGAIAGYVSAL